MKRLTIVILPIFLAAIANSAAYGGISFGGRDTSQRDSPERSSWTGRSGALDKIEQAYLKGDYEKVVILGNNYLMYSAKSDDELQYLMGRALLKLNRFDEARNRFLRIVNDSKGDKLLDEAYIGLADSYYLEGDYKKAKEHYENVMRYFPDSDDLSIVYYRLGECHSKLGDGSPSKDYYDKLSKVYPDSFETKLLAGEKSKYVTYSIQVGSFKGWKNAKRLCDELKSRGFDANISTIIVGNSRFYRVRVGRYNQRSEAEDMARALRNKGYPVKICP